MEKREGSIQSEGVPGRDRTEEALRKSEERYRFLFERSPAVNLIIDADGRMRDVTKSFADRLGYSKDEIMGKQALEFVVGEQREKVAAVLEMALRGEDTPEMDVDVYAKNGSVHAILFSPGQVVLKEEGQPTSVLFTGADITERKGAEEKLRESEERFRGIAERSFDMIFTTDLEGRITYASPFVKRVLGRGPEEIVGDQFVGRLVGSEIRVKAAQSFATVMKGGSVEGLQLDAVAKDGSRLFLEINASPIFRDGKVIGVQGIARDITERKRAEDALRRLAEEAAALQATILDITCRHDLAVLLETIVERAARLLRVSSGGMYLCDPQKREARCVVAYRTPYDVKGTVLKYGEGVAGTVAETGKPLLVDDYRTWEGRAVAYEETKPFVAVLGVPVIWQGRVTGVIDVLDDRPQHFTKGDQELLTLFANHAAIAIENARLMEYERQHTTELEQMVYERTKKLAESEKRLDYMIKSNPAVIYSGKPLADGSDLLLTYLSERVVAMLGYEPRDFIGHPEFWDRHVPAEDVSRVRAEIPHLWREGRYAVEFRFLHKDGTYRWIREEASVVRDMDGNPAEVNGYWTDVTAGKEAEQALKESERKYRQLIETAREGICVYDKDGRITLVNPRFAKMMGYAPDEMVGNTVFILMDDQDARIVEQKTERRRTGIADEYEIELRRKDGAHISTRVSGSPIMDEKGNFVGGMFLASDLTERKKMEARLAEARRLAAIGETAAMIGHDLRNPLQTISSSIYLAKKTLKSPKAEKRKGAAKLLKTLDEEVYYMDKIVSDLQDYARPLTADLVETNLSNIIRNTISTTGIPRTVRVSVTVQKGLSKIVVDPTLMRRVLTNLMTNALQTMPQGGRLTIRASKKRKATAITVQDTGEGIPRENMKKIFTPFFTTKAKGQGLGLAVCKRLVEAQGGRITVKSKVGKGSTFTVEIPARTKPGAR